MNTNAPRLCASAIFITTSCAYSPVLEHAFPRFFRPMEKKKIQTNSKRILVTFSLIDWNKLRWDVNFISREGEKEEKERKEQKIPKDQNAKRWKEWREKSEVFYQARREKDFFEKSATTASGNLLECVDEFSTARPRFWRSTQVSFANMSAKRSPNRWRSVEGNMLRCI